MSLEWKDALAHFCKLDIGCGKNHYYGKGKLHPSACTELLAKQVPLCSSCYGTMAFYLNFETVSIFRQEKSLLLCYYNIANCLILILIFLALCNLWMKLILSLNFHSYFFGQLPHPLNAESQPSRAVAFQ